MSDPEKKVIRELPKSMINKIAAGEVVERPANAIKELVENSVDAGATRIDVEVEKGGVELLKVIDNGCGIPADQIQLALSPHATSKIAEPDDLFRIATLGFRGEALASITEISHLTMTTRAADASDGARVRCNGSDLGPVESSGRNVGTTIEIRDLFFNVPVRRKFLKSAGAEYGAIREALIRIALPNPEIAFTLRHNGVLDLNFTPANDMIDRIRAAFGNKVVEQLIPVEKRYTENGLVLSGYVAKPEFARGTTAMQYLFVNGRFFKDKALTSALKNAYAGLLKQGMFPVVFLCLETPPDFVDVNVHPTKQEVRFADSQAIYSVLLHGVREKLLRSNMETRPSVAQIADAAGVGGLLAPKEAPDSASVLPARSPEGAGTPPRAGAPTGSAPSRPAPEEPRELRFVPDVDPRDERRALNDGVAERQKARSDEWLRTARAGSAKRRADRDDDSDEAPRAAAGSRRAELDDDAVARTIQDANDALAEAARRAAEERAAADAAQLTRVLTGQTSEFRKFPNLNDGPVASRFGVHSRKPGAAAGPAVSDAHASSANGDAATDDSTADSCSFKKGSFGGRALPGVPVDDARDPEPAASDKPAPPKKLVPDAEPLRALSYDERRARIRGNYDSAAAPKDRLLARTSDGRPVVQFCNRYLVMEAPDGIAIVDQHALHERLLYEKVKAGYEQKNVDVQRLLVPEAVDLTPTEYAFTIERKELFESLGLLIDAFGGSSVVVNGYPAVFSASSPRDIFLAALGALYRNRGKVKLSDLVEGAICQMACKAAIKAGDKLTPDSVAELIAHAEMEVFAHHCPHGRPSTVVFSTTKIDQFFKRDNPGDPRRADAD